MKQTVKIPELLSPAGSPVKLRFALNYGADAVYAAGKHFGMRAAANNFTDQEFAEAVRYAHAKGKKVYAAVNIMPHDDEYVHLEKYLESLGRANVDALICADLGTISLAREMLPDIPIHVSTQASVTNARAAEAYLRLGCRRVILARELTLSEIKELRRRCSRELELEVFVHGSMCVAYSGRCLLSNYLTGRDANRGECAQPCRWNYRVRYLEFEEQKRPGMFIPAEENEFGTFVLSSRDLCMIRHIPELCEAGIDSLKIEGRMKSEYYAAVTANAYRIALDSYAASPENYVFDERLWGEVESVSHREYSTGFFFGPPQEDANVCSTLDYIRDKAYLAVAQSRDIAPPEKLQHEAATKGLTLYRFVQSNKFKLGDTVSILTPGKTGRAFVAELLYDAEGNPIDSTPHPLMEFWLGVPFEVKEGDILRG
ncbi:MAG: peptidase U32 family protein [Eubacteriales bacterium]|jgi:putative protease|nr:U32 family peptidase [Clostridiales bacterium]